MKFFKTFFLACAVGFSLAGCAAQRATIATKPTNNWLPELRVISADTIFVAATGDWNSHPWNIKVKDGQILISWNGIPTGAVLRWTSFCQCYGDYWTQMGSGNRCEIQTSDGGFTVPFNRFEFIPFGTRTSETWKVETRIEWEDSVLYEDHVFQVVTKNRMTPSHYSVGDTIRIELWDDKLEPEFPRISNDALCYAVVTDSGSVDGYHTHLQRVKTKIWVFLPKGSEFDVNTRPLMSSDYDVVFDGTYPSRKKFHLWGIGFPFFSRPWPQYGSFNVYAENGVIQNNGF